MKDDRHFPASTPEVASRQQEAAAPDSGGRSAAPCGSLATTTPVRILRLPEVMARVGYRRASIYQFMAAGTFPKSISLGPRAVGWLESDIAAWIAARVQARQAKT